MSEILNTLFKRNTSSSLKYRTHRFCNYIVLNFSIHCKYLDEVGINVENNLVSLTVKTDFDNRELFERYWIKLLECQFFKEESEFLKGKGILFEKKIVDRPFTNTLIKKFSNYYFFPRRTKNRHIFKYTAFNKNLISLLTNNHLWFSDPSTFNDPFDCRCIIDADLDDYEIRSFYYNLSKRNGETHTYSSFFQTFEIPSMPKFLKDLEEHHFRNSIRQQGICCFTEKYNDKLMWAHYADNVSGVCLVFDISVEVAEGYYSYSGDKVKYRNGPVRKFYDASGKFEVTDVLYTKNKVWQYEFEIRERAIFEKGDTNRVISFDPKSLVGIIFGAKMSPTDKQTIKSLISQMSKYKVELIDSYIDLASGDIRLSKNRLGLK